MRCVECDRQMAPGHTSREQRGGLIQHSGRGLCSGCYWRVRRDDRLPDYERASRPLDELLEEWAWLRSEGYTKRQAAERLGMKWKTFEKALERAEKRAAA